TGRCGAEGSDPPTAELGGAPGGTLRPGDAATPAAPGRSPQRHQRKSATRSTLGPAPARRCDHCHRREPGRARNRQLESPIVGIAAGCTRCCRSEASPYPPAPNTVASTLAAALFRPLVSATTTWKVESQKSSVQ